MQRRLAAILIADVVGYSRLMSRDEAGTLTALKTRRKTIFEPLVGKHHGRLVKLMGDGALVEFASAVNAVTCAVELQAAMEAANESLPEDQRLIVRIGLNLGEVVVEGGDLYGDGVNVAARLEAMADPGTVILSQAVFDQVRGKVAFHFEDLGEQSLKNIPEPIRLHRISGERAVPRVAPRAEEPSSQSASTKPFLIVLPFTNMSSDPEQEYFSDGITEDIITDLSQVSAISVVARNTAFAFKDKAVEIGQLARQLKLRYILEGSARKAGNRIRITAQLVDGATGRNLWAERYDRELGDVFALQDDITRSVIAALKVRLLPAESRSVADRSTSNAEAYEYYLKGRSKFLQSWGSIPTLKSARALFAKAVEIDPGYARAYTGVADCDAFLWLNGDLDISFEDLLAISTKALDLAPNMAEAHSSQGMALYVAGRAEEAPTAFERAIELDPLLFGAHFVYALNCRNRGDLGRAALLFERASELRSDDFASLTLLANVYEMQGRIELSNQTARRSLIRIESTLDQRQDVAEVLGIGAATLVYLGENARAVEWAERAVSLEPRNYAVRYNVACAYAVIGNADAALEHLEYIFSHVPRARPWLQKASKNDPQLNSLRGRADFQAFMERLATNSES